MLPTGTVLSASNSLVEFGCGFVVTLASGSTFHLTHFFEQLIPKISDCPVEFLVVSAQTSCLHVQTSKLLRQVPQLFLLLRNCRCITRRCSLTCGMNWRLISGSWKIWDSITGPI